MEHGDLDLSASLSWQSQNLKDALASLLLIDQASIMDKALDLALKGYESNDLPGYKSRLKVAVKNGRLLDFSAQEKLWDDRNDSGHDRVIFSWRDLLTHEAVVKRQLASWGVHRSIHLLPPVCERRTVGEDKSSWRRKIWVGVEESASDRAWSYTITESAQRSRFVERPEDSTAFGLDESLPEWCRMERDPDVVAQHEMHGEMTISFRAEPGDD